MCVGVPMQIIEINYPLGVAEAKGVKRDIGLQLLPEGDIQLGDHVVVHVGFAIEKIDKERSDEIWQGLNELLELMDQEDDSA
ncbi:MAG: hydrogenase assembly protein HypC [Nitrospira bacterium SG8_35_1]|nr:MAG: hydrogenase assembly protein HypC [Nitrospira bacterium SG8_35_1]UCH45998.1 MAG: HypC/HybG/HupF family hydrogenase formation chaperone [Nitrospiraceae bacterium]